MAYLNTTHAPSIFDRIRNAALAAKSRWTAYRLYRSTFEELSRLSDRELNDLGLSRTDLRPIARESAHI